MDDLQHEIVNFTHGEEIVGMYGKLESMKERSTWGREYVSKNFVSLGFILNQCENMKLTQFSSEVGRAKDERKRLYELDKRQRYGIRDEPEDHSK